MTNYECAILKQVQGDKDKKMKKEKHYYVYILTNKKRGVLYIGVTNNVLNRNWQHKQKENKNSFTAKYNADKLVYYEMYSDVYRAINREKQLKQWHRDWKINLIEKDNPEWRDLFNDF
jgi:putative endonuclease